MTLKEILMSKSIIGESECWLWQGSTNGHYGKIWWDSKYQVAHRKSYEEFIGAIPNGFLILHSCDCTLCINPDHLFVGTQKDNMDDMRAKHRDNYIGNPGEYNSMARLTNAKILEIRKLLREGLHSQQEIGNMFDVSQSIISQVKLGKVWSHVT